MPKPIFGDNGSGMHTHQSLWKEGTPLFADKSGYAGLSQLARSYLAGIIMHAPALLAFCAPTTNSLPAARAGLRGPGEPRLLAAEPLGGDPHPDVLGVRAGQATRVPLPDPTANPYLAFAAMLMAGVDGVQKASTQASRRTSTSSRSGTATSRRSPARSPRPWTRSSATMSSSSPGTSSARS